MNPNKNFCAVRSHFRELFGENFENELHLKTYTTVGPWPGYVAHSLLKPLTSFFSYRSTYREFQFILDSLKAGDWLPKHHFSMEEVGFLICDELDELSSKDLYFSSNWKRRDVDWFSSMIEAAQWAFGPRMQGIVERAVEHNRQVHELHVCACGILCCMLRSCSVRFGETTCRLHFKKKWTHFNTLISSLRSWAMRLFRTR